MQGYYVDRRGGWDTHGLPVEIEVKSNLVLITARLKNMGLPNLTSLPSISFSRIQDWEKMTDQIGYWVDLDRSYITYKNEYIRSVWALLKTFRDKGLLYQGYGCSLLPTLQYRFLLTKLLRVIRHRDPSIYVRFRLLDEPDTSLLVWTTTPWTLPGNVAIAAHPEVEYALVEIEGDGKLILAKALLDKVLAEKPYQVLKTMMGTELKGLRYEPLFIFFKLDKASQNIVNADYVTTEDGTGLFTLPRLLVWTIWKLPRKTIYP